MTGGAGDARDLRELILAAQRIQSEVARVKEELSLKTVEGESGGGMVRCVVSGTGTLLELSIDSAVAELAKLAAPNQGVVGGASRALEDLIVGAVNLAMERARELARQEMEQVTAGLPMPPGMFGA